MHHAGVCIEASFGHLGIWSSSCNAISLAPSRASKVGWRSVSLLYVTQRNPQNVRPTNCETNMTTVGVLKGDYSEGALLDAPQISSQTTEEEHGLTHMLSPINIGPNLHREDESTASPIRSTNVPGKSQLLQPSQSPRHQRSDSEAVEKPITCSLPLQAQMNRASTAPCTSTGKPSLLLVDDNVNDSPKLVISNPTNGSNRLLIFAFLRSLLKRADMYTVQRGTGRRPWRFMKAAQNKNVQMKTITQTLSWP